MGKKYTYSYMNNVIEGFGCSLEEEFIKNILTSIKIRCSCGKIWRTNFSSFQNSKHHCCKKCSAKIGSKKRIIDIKYVKKFFKERGYHILNHVDFRYNSKMNVVDENGFKYFISYDNLKTIDKVGRSGPAKFGRKNPYSKHNAKKWIALNNVPLQIIGGIFSVTKKTIRVKCKFCNHIWLTNWDCIYHKHYCPKCKSSSGELFIMDFLELNKIDYKFNFCFDDCKDKNKLKFDFYFLNKNIAIEYQGRQHYEPVSFFGGEKVFNKQQLHDRIKREYCKKNDIELIEIPYWDFNDIELILMKNLKKSYWKENNFGKKTR